MAQTLVEITEGATNIAFKTETNTRLQQTLGSNATDTILRRERQLRLQNTTYTTPGQGRQDQLQNKTETIL